MATYVFIRSIKDKGSEAAWERTSYKSLAKWIAGTGATEEPISLRPGLTTFCYKLPDGRKVRADVMDEETLVEYREIETALDSVIDYAVDEKKPMRWRAKALGDAIQAERPTRANR